MRHLEAPLRDENKNMWLIFGNVFSEYVGYGPLPVTVESEG